MQNPGNDKPSKTITNLMVLELGGEVLEPGGQLLEPGSTGNQETAPEFQKSRRFAVTPTRMNENFKNGIENFDRRHFDVIIM